MSRESLEKQLYEALAGRTRAEAMLSNTAKMREDGQIDGQRCKQLEMMYSERIDQLSEQIENVRTALRGRRERTLRRIEEIGGEERDLELRLDMGQVAEQKAREQARAFERERAQLEDQIDRLTCLMEAETADQVSRDGGGTVDGKSPVPVSPIDERTGVNRAKHQCLKTLERLADTMTGMPVIEPLAAPLREYLGSGRTLTLVAGIASTVAAGFLPMAMGFSLKLMNLSPLTLAFALGVVALHFVGYDKARAAGQAVLAVGAAVAWTLVATRLNSAGVPATFGHYIYISGAVAALIGAHMQTHEQ